jgi:hypothetical protein
MSYLTEIKELFTAIFYGVATVLGILTYCRAKATILQPIRTEVIRKQSTILSKLLTLISRDEIESLDYIKLVELNVLSILLDYGFVFSEHEDAKELVKSNTDGVVPCGENSIVGGLRLFQPFDSTQDIEKVKNEEKQRRKKKYEKARKDGIIIVDRIKITKKHNCFVDKLKDFAANPFIPSGIQESVKDLIQTVNLNLTIHLKQVLEDFTKELFKKYSSDPTLEFSTYGVYNDFNHKRHRHNQFEDIKKEIRGYLRIEEKW